MKKDTELLKLSENIKAARKKQNLSQEKLASICDFDRTYISLLERGKRNPSYFNLKKLTKGLNMSLSQLLEGL